MKRSVTIREPVVLKPRQQAEGRKQHNTTPDHDDTGPTTPRMTSDSPSAAPKNPQRRCKWCREPATTRCSRCACPLCDNCVRQSRQGERDLCLACLFGSEETTAETPRTIIDDDESHTTTTVLETPTEDEEDKRETKYDMDAPRYAPGATPQEGRRGGEAGTDLVEAARLYSTACEALDGSTQLKVQAAVQAGGVLVQATGGWQQAVHAFRAEGAARRPPLRIHLCPFGPEPAAPDPVGQIRAPRPECDWCGASDVPLWLCDWCNVWICARCIWNVGEASVCAGCAWGPGQDSLAEDARSAGIGRDVCEIEHGMDAPRYDMVAVPTLDSDGLEAQYPARRAAKANAKVAYAECRAGARRNKGRRGLERLVYKVTEREALPMKYGDRVAKSRRIRWATRSPDGAAAHDELRQLATKHGGKARDTPERLDTRYAPVNATSVDSWAPEDKALKIDARLGTTGDRMLPWPAIKLWYGCGWKVVYDPKGPGSTPKCHNDTWCPDALRKNPEARKSELWEWWKAADGTTTARTGALEAELTIDDPEEASARWCPPGLAASMAEAVAETLSPCGQERTRVNNEPAVLVHLVRYSRRTEGTVKLKMFGARYHHAAFRLEDLLRRRSRMWLAIEDVKRLHGPTVQKYPVAIQRLRWLRTHLDHKQKDDAVYWAAIGTEGFFLSRAGDFRAVDGAPWQMDRVLTGKDAQPRSQGKSGCSSREADETAIRIKGSQTDQYVADLRPPFLVLGWFGPAVVSAALDNTLRTRTSIRFVVLFAHVVPCEGFDVQWLDSVVGARSWLTLLALLVALYFRKYGVTRTPPPRSYTSAATQTDEMVIATTPYGRRYHTNLGCETIQGSNLRYWSWCRYCSGRGGPHTGRREPGD